MNYGARIDTTYIKDGFELLSDGNNVFQKTFSLTNLAEAVSYGWVSEVIPELVKHQWLFGDIFPTPFALRLEEEHMQGLISGVKLVTCMVCFLLACVLFLLIISLQVLAFFVEDPLTSMQTLWEVPYDINEGFIITIETN